MKKLWALVLFSVLILAACSTHRGVTRGAIVAELPGMTTYEQRYVHLLQVIPQLSQFLSTDDLDHLKQRRDVAFIYYHGSLTALVAGNTEEYKRLLALATAEIDAAVAFVREKLKAKYH